MSNSGGTKSYKSSLSGALLARTERRTTVFAGLRIATGSDSLGLACHCRFSDSKSALQALPVILQLLEQDHYCLQLVLAQTIHDLGPFHTRKLRWRNSQNFGTFQV